MTEYFMLAIKAAAIIVFLAPACLVAALTPEQLEDHHHEDQADT